MRFDDRLTTALRQPTGSSAEADVQWRQLVDILAQHPSKFDAADVATGLRRAADLSEMVPLQVRVASVRSLYGRLRSPPLISLLAHQPPAVCAAAVASARLSDGEWEALIPELPSRARGYLRNRRDLGARALETLDQWKSADFRLPPVVSLAEHRNAAPFIAPPMDVAQAELQGLADGAALPETAEHTDNAPRPQNIGEILHRIERVRQQRAQLDAPYLPLDDAFAEEAESPDAFRIVTDDTGVIIFADLPQSAALVGIGIDEPAFDDVAGPDAYAAAAFQQRMPIDNARLRLLSPQSLKGDWLIVAEPMFDAESGRFRGYDGVLRRPNCAENAVIADPDAQAHSEQLQQWLHELRTPLGAIIGFGEIIEQQLFGPVSHDYRELAQSILEDAHRLLDSFDDMAIAARLDNGTHLTPPGQTDGAWLFERIRARLQTLTEVRGVDLNLAKAEPLRPFALEPSAVERIFTRLLSAVVMGATAKEALETRLRTIVGARPVNVYRIALPHRLRGIGEHDLLNSGSAPDEGDAGDGKTGSLLGLGFSLRLVRSLANNAGGNLLVENDALLLSLPALSENRMGA